MMLAIPLQEVAAVLGREPGTLTGVVTGLSTDSRTISEGDLFVALTGRRTSGDRFVGEALAGGAAAAVTSGAATADARVIRVEDPEVALGLVAGLVRKRFTRLSQYVWKYRHENLQHSFRNYICEKQVVAYAQWRSAR